MKKITFLFLAGLLYMGPVVSQSHMVAGWTFPGNSPAADTGASANLDREIITMGGTSAIELKNGYATKAAQASGWNDGADQKAWGVTLSTAGFMNLTLSSRQQSGGNDPGPKYFRLQYSLDGGGAWTDLEGGDVTVENDWETSFVDQLALPEACDDQEELMIRWLMVSNEASGTSGNVAEDGKSKIDEIFVRGDLINAVAEVRAPAVSLLPGADGSTLAVHASEAIGMVLVHALGGQLIGKAEGRGNQVDVDLGSLSGGHLVLVTIEFIGLHNKKTVKYLYPSFY